MRKIKLCDNESIVFQLKRKETMSNNDVFKLIRDEKHVDVNISMRDKYYLFWLGAFSGNKNKALGKLSFLDNMVSTPTPDENKRNYVYLSAIANGWTGEVDDGRMIIDIDLAIEKEMEIKKMSKPATKNKIKMYASELIKQRKLLPLKENVFILCDAVMNMRIHV